MCVRLWVKVELEKVLAWCFQGPVSDDAASKGRVRMRSEESRENSDDEVKLRWVESRGWMIRLAAVTRGSVAPVKVDLLQEIYGQVVVHE